MERQSVIHRLVITDAWAVFRLKQEAGQVKAKPDAKEEDQCEDQEFSLGLHNKTTLSHSLKVIRMEICGFKHTFQKHVC